MMKNSLILGQDQYYSMDCYKTKVNNNVLVVGAAGSGKTRGLVIPNILQATGSYIISDPKGQLYRDYADYLRNKGYKIKVLDFMEPKKSTQYNFFDYINSEKDIIKVSRMLNTTLCGGLSLHDPFWDDASEMLLTALIAYLYKYKLKREQNIEALCKLLALCQIKEDPTEENRLDKLFKDTLFLDSEDNNFAYRQYQKFRIGAADTLRSIIISLNTRFKALDFAEFNKMTHRDQMDITDIGKVKTAVFVIVSDMERSMDCIANLFYSQAFDELCKYADRECGGKLPVDVRFILDDFATNCVIADFPKKISAFRSRGISTMLMLQAEQQLNACYPREGNIIIGNCDNYVYLGGNDLDTAKSIGIRCNIPTDQVLNMPIETSWIIRRGQRPILSKNFDVDSYLKLVEQDLKPKEQDEYSPYRRYKCS